MSDVFDVSQIDDHFVMDEYREGQKHAIEFVLKAFNSGKKIVILEAPTGSGKTAIGMTIANFVERSFYLTITKNLQDQLVRDFGDDVVDVKGRNAYPCTFYDRYGPKMVERKLWTAAQLEEAQKKKVNCGAGFCRTQASKNLGSDGFKCSGCFTVNGPGVYKRPKGDLLELPAGMNYSACPYYEQIFTALGARNVVMNFSSFLYQTSMTKRFSPRDLLILDEAHNIEPQLLDFVSLSITDAHIQKHGIFLPKLNSALEYALWFEKAQLANKIYEAINEAKEKENTRQEDDLVRLLKKYHIFMKHTQDSDIEWIAEYKEKTERKNTMRSVTLKPIYIKDFTQSLLFRHSERALLMSATILDADIFCSSLGLKREEVAALRMKNRFPAEHRPIYLLPTAKLTGGRAKMGEWMPPLIAGVEKVVRKYPDKRGIIHTHNFAIMEGLLSGCAPDVSSRLLNQRDFLDKQALLAHHATTTNGIIIAPAMHEGVDLVQDLSRFQIICKVPYPNHYDDAQLARRVEVDPRFYLWLTALKLCQSYGRSIRSADDYADTYILDESIYRFLRDAKKMLPGWFLEAIKE